MSAVQEIFLNRRTGTSLPVCFRYSAFVPLASLFQKYEADVDDRLPACAFMGERDFNFDLGDLVGSGYGLRILVIPDITHADDLIRDDMVRRYFGVRQILFESMRPDVDGRWRET